MSVKYDDVVGILKDGGVAIDQDLRLRQCSKYSVRHFLDCEEVVACRRRLSTRPSCTEEGLFENRGAQQNPSERLGEEIAPALGVRMGMSDRTMLAGVSVFVQKASITGRIRTGACQYIPFLHQLADNAQVKSARVTS